MDFNRADRVAHRGRRRHHHRRAAGRRRTTRREMGIFTFDDLGQDHRLRGEADPRAPRRDRRQHAEAARSRAAPRPSKPFVASMGIYVFNREVLLEILERAGRRFRQGDHPEGALDPRRQPVHLSRLLGRRRHDRGVLRGQHPADAARRAVQLLPSALADLHPSAVPAGDACVRLPHRIVDRRRGLLSRPAARSRARWSASGRTSVPGARITRSVLLGADSYEEDTGGATRSRSASAATPSSIA